MSSLAGKNILLIVSGGIAAYKALELIRLIRKAEGTVTCILTSGGQRIVTPLSAAAISGNPVYTDLWSLKDESEMGHIRLSREADLIVVAPASANLIGKAACGLADDLASTVLLASDKPVLIAPAMNPEMWAKDAVRENIRMLETRGVRRIGPDIGDTACGEQGEGRMADPQTIAKEIESFFCDRPLKGKRAIVTSGPTYEPLDPVRFIGNRSSGKQGHAVAAALARAGADVTLVSGPVAIPDPPDVSVIRVETAAQMRNAVHNALPADIAVCAAAVADWRPERVHPGKIKKLEGDAAPAVSLTENPDILKSLCEAERRPALVIGFAAETGNVVEEALAKRRRKGCDWIVANLVGQPDRPVFGEEENHVYFVSESPVEEWPKAHKNGIAERLVNKITERLGT